MPALKTLHSNTNYFLLGFILLLSSNTGLVSGQHLAAVCESGNPTCRARSFPMRNLYSNRPGPTLCTTQKSAANGLYSFRDIAPGVYTLTIRATGFQEKRFDQVTFVLNEIHELNVTLAVGEVSQVVEVQADQTSIVSQQTSVGTLIDGARIRELPLNGRDFENLVFLAPGAVRTASGTGQGSDVSAGGARPTDNDYLIDGGDANNPRTPGEAAGNISNATSSVPLDAIAESASSPATHPLSLAAASGSIINVVTKSRRERLPCFSVGVPPKLRSEHPQFLQPGRIQVPLPAKPIWILGRWTPLPGQDLPTRLPTRDSGSARQVQPRCRFQPPSSSAL